MKTTDLEAHKHLDAVFIECLGAFSQRVRQKLPRLSKQRERLVDGSLAESFVAGIRQRRISAFVAWRFLATWAQRSWVWILSQTPATMHRAPWKQTATAFQLYLLEKCGTPEQVEQLMHGGLDRSLPSDALLSMTAGLTADAALVEVRRVLDWIEANDASMHYGFYRLHPQTAAPDDIEALISKSVIHHRASIERDGADPKLSREHFVRRNQNLVDFQIHAQPELHPADPSMKVAEMGSARNSDVWLIALWPLFTRYHWTARDISAWVARKCGSHAVPQDYEDFGTHLRRLGLFGATGAGRPGKATSIPMLDQLDVQTLHPGFPPLLFWYVLKSLHRTG